LKERMQYILMNLGMSKNFGDVDLEHVKPSDWAMSACANF
jgi:hypothetical protein